MSGRFIIHIGEGEARQSYELDFNKLLNVEAIAIERVTATQDQPGLTLQDLAFGILRSSMVAVTALVWVLRKRNEPRLKFHEVVFHPAELEIEDLDAPDDEAPEDEAPEAAEDETAAPKAPPAKAKKATKKAAQRAAS